MEGGRIRGVGWYMVGVKKGLWSPRNGLLAGEGSVAVCGSCIGENAQNHCHLDGIKGAWQVRCPGSGNSCSCGLWVSWQREGKGSEGRRGGGGCRLSMQIVYVCVCVRVYGEKLSVCVHV